MAEPAAAQDRVVRLVSIVAIDVVGFSTMSERDHHRAARHVENLRARIQRVAEANEGRLFNTAGDGFMLEFNSAGSALHAIQELLDKRGRGEPRIRVGAHVGDVIVTATDDLLGHGVNVAARLQQLAAPGSALVSAEFRSMAHSSPTASFLARGRQPLENIEQKVQTFEILSSRQRFARSMRNVMSFLVAALVIAALVLMAPTIWGYAQHYLPAQAPAQHTESAQPAQTASAPAATTELAAAPAPTSAASSVPVMQPAAPTHQPGDIYRACPDCPQMIVLAGGAYQMGSPVREAGRRADEGPQHQVTLAPFAVSKTEVTFAQWDACVAGGGCNRFVPSDHGWGRADRPVLGVSWSDAQAYVRWLNQQPGAQHYRLLTEAEWEFAARGGTTAPYATNAHFTARQATFGARMPTTVGAHPANGFQLSDMLGNVSEWVEDCYSANYQLAPSDGSAIESDECTRRVFRGGSYADPVNALRVAARKSAAPDARLPGVGFRVAQALN